MNDREQVINFLFQSGDNKERIIADLQKKNAELQKLVDELQKPKEDPIKDKVVKKDIK